MNYYIRMQLLPDLELLCRLELLTRFKAGQLEGHILLLSSFSLFPVPSHFVSQFTGLNHLIFTIDVQSFYTSIHTSMVQAFHFFFLKRPNQTWPPLQTWLNLFLNWTISPSTPFNFFISKEIASGKLHETKLCSSPENGVELSIQAPSLTHFSVALMTAWVSLPTLRTLISQFFCYQFPPCS